MVGFGDEGPWPVVLCKDMLSSLGTFFNPDGFGSFLTANCSMGGKQ